MKSLAHRSNCLRNTRGGVNREQLCPRKMPLQLYRSPDLVQMAVERFGRFAEHCPTDLCGQRRPLSRPLPVNRSYIVVNRPGSLSATSTALKALRRFPPTDSYGIATDAAFKQGSETDVVAAGANRASALVSGRPREYRKIQGKSRD